MLAEVSFADFLIFFLLSRSPACFSLDVFVFVFVRRAGLELSALVALETGLLELVSEAVDLSAVREGSLGVVTESSGFWAEGTGIESMETVVIVRVLLRRWRRRDDRFRDRTDEFRICGATSKANID